MHILYNTGCQVGRYWWCRLMREEVMAFMLSMMCRLSKKHRSFPSTSQVRLWDPVVGILGDIKMSRECFCAKVEQISSTGIFTSYSWQLFQDQNEIC